MGKRMNSKVIVQLGSTQESFSNGGYYSESSCDLIEYIVSCDKMKLSDYGGNGRIRFLDENGSMTVQLTIDGGNSFMSDESKSIVVIRSKGGTIRSNAYYGIEADLEFKPHVNEYSMVGVEKHVESIKDFYKSWQVVKGEISAVVIVVDNKSIFDEVMKNTIFDDCYVLLAE